jgi:hypothetical protein
MTGTTGTLAATVVELLRDPDRIEGRRLRLWMEMRNAIAAGDICADSVERRNTHDTSEGVRRG